MKSMEQHQRTWFLEANERARESAKRFGLDALKIDMQNARSSHELAVDLRRRELAGLGTALSFLAMGLGLFFGIVLGVAAALRTMGVWFDAIIG